MSKGTGSEQGKHHLSGQTIAIAGAGIAGLSFAIALTKQWSAPEPPPTVIIYERDSAEDALGREGYSLSLRSDPPGGIQALQKLGVLDTMTEASIKNTAASSTGSDESGGFCIWDRKWQPIIKVRAVVPDGLPVGSLRIARRNLRKVLIDAAVEKGCTIHWGVSCTGLSTTATASLGGVDKEAPVPLITLTLSDGSTAKCNMVIAADGASSRIRAQLRPDDKLQFQNIVMVSGTAVYPEGTAPPAPLNHDWGIMPLNHNHTALFFSPVGPNTALWSVSWSSDKPSTITGAPPVSAEVADWALTQAKDRVNGLLPPLYDELLELTDKQSIMAFNIRDKEAFTHDCASLPAEFGGGKVIFIGDTNHAVSPFAGNGANMALCDGWELAAQLLAAGSSEEGVQNYDKLVIEERRKVTQRSHFNMNVAHSQGWRLSVFFVLLRILKLVFFRYVR
jgi:2-polyprenyl-6-methoxyphenol hydroxylase-like FAD-dependent oxidoreductase